MRSVKRVPRNPTDRLLPEGRLGGPMPWVVAIMVFLTMLAAAGGLVLGGLAQALGGAVEGRLTVQIPGDDAKGQGAATGAVARRLTGIAGVTAVRIVPRERLLDQLRPWLGADLGDAGLPVPALIDVDVAAPQARADDLRRAIASAAADAAPGARLVAHADFLAPLARFVRSVVAGAIAVVGLMAIATAATVVLAARGALAAHRSTIEVMHMLGATDQQVTRLFQRRLTLDVAFGAALGLVVAAVVAYATARAIAQLGGDMVAGLTLPFWSWLLLPMLAALFILIARVAARIALSRSLARAL